MSQSCQLLFIFRCSTYFNVFVDHDRCDLEVVRGDGVALPYYYGHMVSDNFRAFLQHVRDLKVITKSATFVCLAPQQVKQRI